jgi:hypothetical protein
MVTISELKRLCLTLQWTLVLLSKCLMHPGFLGVLPGLPARCRRQEGSQSAMTWFVISIDLLSFWDVLQTHHDASFELSNFLKPMTVQRARKFPCQVLRIKPWSEYLLDNTQHGIYLVVFRRRNNRSYRKKWGYCTKQLWIGYDAST